jgi:hypothetical protein
MSQNNAYRCLQMSGLCDDMQLKTAFARARKCLSEARSLLTILPNVFSHSHTYIIYIYTESLSNISYYLRYGFVRRLQGSNYQTSEKPLDIITYTMANKTCMN